MRFSVTYYDGQSTRAHPVELEVDEVAGVVRLHGLAAPQSHALASLKVSPRIGNTVRSVTFPDDARAESSDHAQLDALAARAGHGRALHLVHLIESRWKSALLAAGILLVFIIAGIRWGIPVVAKRLAEAVPAELAYDLGKSTLVILDRSVLAPSKLSDVRKAELVGEFQRMAREYPELPLRLHFRNGLGANAFALPDGTVVVTDELVDLAKDDREILAVLAHEIGHVHFRHSLRVALESSSIAMLVSAYLGDIGQISTLSAALPAAYAQAHYSREHETEADGFAFEYMTRAGVPHHFFADILEKLEEKNLGGKSKDDGTAYLASHPPTVERIERFRRAKK
ncbi:MAG: M48 family metallopeptidase [Myxococcota bacterium]|jgi:Zn-dependent protease with chaperone function|nr:M48 family metallopeptidase [Myxococcota bacterium]